jgi:hypothetical protein
MKALLEIGGVLLVVLAFVTCLLELVERWCPTDRQHERLVRTSEEGGVAASGGRPRRASLLRRPASPDPARRASPMETGRS